MARSSPVGSWGRARRGPRSRTAGWVIEAAAEDASLKADLLRKLDDVCATDAILATNTSSISITTLANITQPAVRVWWRTVYT
jgi:3-hydroxyacyl-CoA dehydrogenase